MSAVRLRGGRPGWGTFDFRLVCIAFGQRPFQERRSRDILGGPEIRAVSFRNDFNERNPQSMRLGVGLTCGVDMDGNPD